MIFFNRFKVPTIKFGKFFAEFMIPIALLKEFGSYEFVTIIEVINIRRCSQTGKANIYTIRGTSRVIAIKKRKINNIKIKASILWHVIRCNIVFVNIYIYIYICVCVCSLSKIYILY